MSKAEIYLFRIKLLDNLFSYSLNRKALLSSAIKEKPSGEYKFRHQPIKWKIGNVSPIDEDGLIFAIGRSRSVESAEIDDSTGDFVNSIKEESPFTYVLCDVRLGILGIIFEANVASTPNAIAQKIRALLNNTITLKNTGISIKIDSINNAEKFIERIKNAFEIKKIKATFTLPNPIDAYELVQKPLEEYLRRAEGKSGSVVFKGNMLDSDSVEELARSAIATGNQAKVTLVEEPDGPQISIDSNGQGDTIIPIDEINLEDTAEASNALNYMRDKYEEIRSGADGNQRI